MGYVIRARAVGNVCLQELVGGGGVVAARPQPGGVMAGACESSRQGGQGRQGRGLEGKGRGANDCYVSH